MGIPAIISLIFGVVVAIWQLFLLVLKVLLYLLQFIIAVGNWTVDAIHSLLLWLDAWLGPVSGAIWGALQPAAIKRAAMLAFAVASVLWMAFSTVANDAFYILINPFFFNAFSYLGHLGFSLAAGAFTFIADAIRRLFHGPTKAQVNMMMSWDRDLRKKIAEDNTPKGITG